MPAETTAAPSPALLRTVAEEAARRAGEYAAGAFRGEMTVAHKRDRHDLVTEHDRAAEDLIVPWLLERVPDSVVVGEEGGRRGAGRAVVWYVDPIDGTSNFAQGLAFWCVAIAAEVDGEVVAGAVYDPVAGLMFSADEVGAYLDGEPLRTPPAQPVDAATLLTSHPSARAVREEGPAVLEDFAELTEAFASLRRIGSAALSIVHVAAGWADSAFGTFGHPWDHAAAMLVLRRAGGTYRPLRYDVTATGEAGSGGAGSGGAAPGEPGSDHLAPGYVALAPGADYPALEAVAARFLERRMRG